MTEGLGPINNKHHKSVGLMLHDTLAFTEQGTPLGILDAQCWARDPEALGKSERRKELPLEQKESMKWLRSFRKVAEIKAAVPRYADREYRGSGIGRRIFTISSWKP